MKKCHLILSLITGLFSTQISLAALKQPTAPASTHHSVLNEDTGSWARDPFLLKVNKPAAVSKSKLNGYKSPAAIVPEEEIVLQGIMRVENNYRALINGRVIKSGDSIGSVTIKHINRYQVELLNERKENVVYDIYQGRIDKNRGKK